MHSAMPTAAMFGRAHGSITLTENGALATLSGMDGSWRSAASTAVMRSGRHFLQFTAVGGSPLFGVLRPGWDVEGGADAEDVDGHCFYRTFTGKRCPGEQAWQGMQGAGCQQRTSAGRRRWASHGDGRGGLDRIGMLLDLDLGSMTVWKNGERLGVMVSEGLTGPLCWAASLGHGAEVCALRIDSAAAPASPTDEELNESPLAKQRPPTAVSTVRAAAASARSRTRGLTNLLTDTPDEAALAIACFLATAKDLLRLQLACKRFSTKSIVAPLGLGAAGPSTALVQRLCIAAEAARRWVAGCSEQERGWVPRRELESWLGLMHEVGVLRLPPVFGRAHGSITLSENGALAETSAEVGFRVVMRSAASKVVMRSGRHFLQFAVTPGWAASQFCFLEVGVIRPGWDVEGGHAHSVGGHAHSVDGHCFYSLNKGIRHPGAWKWGGMQTAARGDRVGMLLDLDKGSMTVWKNGERLGVMQAEGLTGPLCWAASLWGKNAVRIESAAAPASPTDEELAAAEAPAPTPGGKYWRS